MSKIKKHTSQEIKICGAGNLKLDAVSCLEIRISIVQANKKYRCVFEDLFERKRPKHIKK